MSIHSEVKKNTYLDSVSLMSISTKLNQEKGVKQAQIAMATPMNKAVLKDLGLLNADLEAAEPSDLMIVFETDDSVEIADLLATLKTLLTRKPNQDGDKKTVYNTLAAACEGVPSSNFVVISVNGLYAPRLAEQALNAGKNVMMFSDNVAIEDELRLKQLAHEKGLLLMGPDCGTAIIGGKGLCFANNVRRGNIGIIGASGTGSQEMSVRVHEFGGGVSQLIGTGGRDLSETIGGITMLDALEALSKDEATEVIVLVSKPPAAKVAEKIIAKAGECGKPVIVNFLGATEPANLPANVTFRAQSKPAALAAVVAAGIDESTIDKHPLNLPLIAEVQAKLKPEQRFVRGLFCGGTLCDEAMFAAREIYDDVFSNIHPDPDHRLGAHDASKAHTFLDFGDDEFTNGRAHPMIDPSYRLQRLLKEGEDPDVGVILLDFVLGYGAHADPVGETLETIKTVQEKAKAAGRHLEILAYVLGTDRDEPSVAEQVAKLEAIGVTIASSSTNAGLLAREFVRKD